MDAPKRIQRKPKWIILSQHWVGYKPTKFGSYSSEQEAVDACVRLDESPSGQWFHYSVKAPTGELTNAD